MDEIRERKKYPNMWGKMDLRPKRQEGMFFSLTSRPSGIQHRQAGPTFGKIQATPLKPISLIPKSRPLQDPIRPPRQEPQYEQPAYQEQEYSQEEYPSPSQEHNVDINQMLTSYYQSPQGQQRAQQIPQKYPQYNQSPEQKEQAVVFMLDGLVQYYQSQGQTIPTTLYRDLYQGIYEGLQ